MRDRGSAAEGELAGGTQRESAALGAGGNAPRGADFFREATRGYAGREGGSSIYRGSHRYRGRDPRDTLAPPSLPADPRVASRDKAAPRGASPPSPDAADSSCRPASN